MRTVTVTVGAEILGIHIVLREGNASRQVRVAIYSAVDQRDTDACSAPTVVVRDTGACSGLDASHGRRHLRVLRDARDAGILQETINFFDWHANDNRIRGPQRPDARAPSLPKSLA